MGRDTAEATQAMIRSASDRMSGLVATLVGVVTIMVAASGVFGIREVRFLELDGLDRLWGHLRVLL